MKPCIIFNPVARGEKAKKFRKTLANFAEGCLLYPTEYAGMGSALAIKAAHEGCNPIIAAGGDGTLNEVINGLAQVPSLLRQIHLGVIPLGTVNVFAKELGIPTTTSGAWKVIRQQKTRWIDLPHVVWEQEGQSTKRYFVQLAGAGLDSRAIDKVNWALKKKIGPLAYVFAGFQAWMGRQPKVQVISDHGTFTGELVLIGNGRFYGGRFELFPKARLDDGLLDICIFENVNSLTLVRSGLQLFTNQIHQHPGIRNFQTRSLRITSEEPLSIELEGDNVGKLPAEIRMDGLQIQVLCGSG